jgi:hypothetical protein
MTYPNSHCPLGTAVTKMEYDAVREEFIRLERAGELDSLVFMCESVQAQHSCYRSVD